MPLQTQEVSLFEAAGFSMRPFLRGKERLLIKKVPLQQLRIGDIILYRSDEGKIICHRLIAKIKDSYNCVLYSRGDASLSRPAVISAQMFLGKVHLVICDGRIVNMEAFFWRLVNRLIVLIAPLVAIAVQGIRTVRNRK